MLMCVCRLEEVARMLASSSVCTVKMPDRPDLRYITPSLPSPLISLPHLSLPTNPKQYATATFKVLNAYAGWSNVNYILNEVRDPIRTLKIAGPLGLGICAVLYMLANVAYFA